MESYNHHSVGGNFIVNDIKNMPVAIIDNGNFHFMVGSGADEKEVKDYCIRMRLCKEETEQIKAERQRSYTYQWNGGTCIVKNVNNQMVVIIKDGDFHFMGVGSEQDVKQFCIEHNLWPNCKGSYSHNDVGGIWVIKNDQHQTVAVIENEVFRFMPNSKANEADVRLYCMAKGLYMV